MRAGGLSNDVISCVTDHLDQAKHMCVSERLALVKAVIQDHDGGQYDQLIDELESTLEPTCSSVHEEHSSSCSSVK